MSELTDAKAQLASLIDERKSIVGEMTELVQAGKTMKANDKEKWDQLDSSANQKDCAIALQERKIKDLSVQANPEPVNRDGFKKGDDVTSESVNNLAVLRRWAKDGIGGITSEEAESFMGTDRFVFNTLTEAGAGTDTSAASGIPTTTAPTITHTLQKMGAVRAMASVTMTATGENMVYPQYDGKDEEGELINKAAARSNTNPSQTGANIQDIGGIVTVPVEFTSKIARVAVKTLRDSAFNVDQFINEQLMRRIGRVTHRYFTVSKGPNAPPVR